MVDGWWLTYPSEKYESQLGWLFPIYGKKMFRTTNQWEFWCCANAQMLHKRASVKASKNGAKDLSGGFEHEWFPHISTLQCVESRNTHTHTWRHTTITSPPENGKSMKINTHYSKHMGTRNGKNHFNLPKSSSIFHNLSDLDMPWYNYPM